VGLIRISGVRLAVEEVTAKQLPVDGRSNLSGHAASLTYTPGADLRELITDEAPLAGPYDGARWELRSSFTKGYNVLTLGHYIVEPRLDDEAAVADFIAGKDRDHSGLAGFRVTHMERVVDGRRGWVWNHGSRDGWFPQPVHSVRVQCIARRQTARFKRLCAEAIRSLEFDEPRLTSCGGRPRRGRRAATRARRAGTSSARRGASCQPGRARHGRPWHR
jgi:hypothetical protein